MSGNDITELDVRTDTVGSRKFIILDLPNDLVSELKKDCSTNCSNYAYNHRLAGNITTEIDLRTKATQSRWYRELQKICAACIEYYSSITDNQDIESAKRFQPDRGDFSLRIGEIWYNSMLPGEFNPIHRHEGVFSFVLFLDIPYSINEEFSQAKSKFSNLPSSGCFSFICDGKPKIIHADKSWNGKLIFFSSEMLHCVYPYSSSSAPRLTVSGNLVTTRQCEKDEELYRITEFIDQK